MLLVFETMNEDEMLRMVQGVYREACLDNARWHHPDCADLSEAIREQEQGFVEFLKEFLAEERNQYFLWEDAGEWVSALRLTKLDGFYYLEALETAPEHRKKGYGAKLMQAVAEYLQKHGPVVIRDNVSKKNVPSLELHKKCGFIIEAENGIDHLAGTQSDRVYGMILRA